MPELPEVETVVRGLRKVLPGRRIMDVRFGKTDFIQNAGGIERDLPGCRVAAIERCGKFLVIGLEKTPQKFDLIIHLGMTGQLTVCSSAQICAPHTHAQMALDDGRELRYTDIRRFGRILLASDRQRDALLGRLGADAMEVDLGGLQRQLAARRAQIKALLLDQRVVRGMGNIYADESLWRARIHPARLASRLRREELGRLLHSIRRVLSEAIECGGSSISDYVDATGQRGSFQVRHRVYQREGKKCFRCGGRIRRMIVAGRSSYYCPRCQRAPRPAVKRGPKSHRQRQTRAAAARPSAPA